jgi:mannosyltransferase OCH1-like enzyme
MSVYGGVYMDLDTECIKNMDKVLKDKQLVLGLLGGDIEWHHSIPNAYPTLHRCTNLYSWMASAPNHPFWQFVLKNIMTRAHLQDQIGVEDLTGPLALRESYLEYMRLPEQQRRPIDLVSDGTQTFI